MKRGCLGALLGIALAVSSEAGTLDDLAREPPRIKPLEPAAALSSFRNHPGFHLEQVAAEPMVFNPVSACYDADGRLYVVEMCGYPYPEKTPTGRVARLEDRDGDGRFDTRTVFVDGLSWPTGVVPYDDGVFVAVAPDLLYAGRKKCQGPKNDFLASMCPKWVPDTNGTRIRINVLRINDLRSTLTSIRVRELYINNIE